MTLPSNLPTSFRTSAHAFAEELRTVFASGIPAQPEDQLKGPVQVLLRAVKPRVVTASESPVYEVEGRPDIGVSVQGALCGHVELKAPGFGARTAHFRGRDKAQWEKFKALPNILYTDSIEWALYRSGEAEGEIVRLGNLIERGAAAVDDSDLAQLLTLLQDFLSWEPVVPADAPALARMLAPLCRLLRADVLVAVQREESALHRLCGEIRDYLFPHVRDAEFADIYAQTLTYALLLARLSGETDLTTATAADRLDSGHGLLAETLRVLTVRAAREEIETPVNLLERVIGAVDPKRLARRGDPWLYFYEDFLAAYDARLRRSYGVYYTPQQVIHCQVALASELLTERFDKPLTFADEGVVFLDSSAGTAAYPIAAIESSLQLAEARFGAGMVPAMATRCAQNVYGFELLVGPYAVAHLRLTNLLTAAGATLPEEGIHMYLTDTLESPHTDPPRPPLMAERLTTEQRRARYVKAQVPIFVCMGNPPYFREEGEDRNRGKWVRDGDPNVPYEQPILRDFTEPAIAAGASRFVANLYNLYVYFWRWTLWKMFENPNASGRGIISFITASSYLRGPGFIGMRQKMREAFDELWIIDLEGGSRSPRPTENVFAIETAVAIAIGVRLDRTRPEVPCTTRYTKITGTRDEKLAQLNSIRSFNDLQWVECSDDWQAAFVPVGVGAFFTWPLLSDLFPWQVPGIKFHRTWPIGETAEVLQERWRALVSARPEERGVLMHETDTRGIQGRYQSLIPPKDTLPSISRLTIDDRPLTPQRYALRSFDRRWMLPDIRLCDRPRPPLWFSYGPNQIYLTTLMTNPIGIGPAAVACSNIPDLHHFRGSWGGKDAIPLWRDTAGRQPNLPRHLLETLRGFYETSVSAEDFFAYTYAILSAPAYVETFSEELSIPGPRLPVTRDPVLFQRGVALGRQLLWLHTYGERFVPSGQRRSQIPAGSARCTTSIPTTAIGYPDTVKWEADRLYIGSGEFRPVSEAVWEFSVSGFFVVQNWIKSRLRDRTGRRSSPLDEIRPTAWTADLTQELLELLWVIEQTIAVQPALNTLLADVLGAPLFSAVDFPQPTPAERMAPGNERDDDDAQQQLLEDLPS